MKKWNTPQAMNWLWYIQNFLFIKIYIIQNFSSKSGNKGTSFDQRLINFSDPANNQEKNEINLFIDNNLIQQQKERVKGLREFLSLDYESFDLFELYPSSNKL